MMKVHNSKVNKIHGKYMEYCALRARSKEEGVSFEELKAQAEQDVGPIKKSKKAKKTIGGMNKRRIMAKGFGAGCEILMKDKDGNVINYDSNDSEND